MIEVSEIARQKVLVDVDENNAIIVGDPQEIFGQQLRPYPIQY
jgi:hypothetical protein